MTTTAPDLALAYPDCDTQLPPGEGTFSFAALVRECEANLGVPDIDVLTAVVLERLPAEHRDVVLHRALRGLVYNLGGGHTSSEAQALGAAASTVGSA